MTARDIENDMKKFTGGASFITITQVTKYLGLSNTRRVRNDYLGDLQKVDNSRYFIPEVARRIYQKADR